MQAKRYSPRTEQAYLHWIVQFVSWTGFRKPETFTAQDATGFLTHLAVDRNVAPATQNQAFNALMFLFVRILEKPFDSIKAERAKTRSNAPEFLSRDELKNVFAELEGDYQLLARLGYGTGMRLMELLRLRIKDVDFGSGLVTVRDAKGGKDRVVPLPQSLARGLTIQVEASKAIHAKDCEAGYGEVWLPHQLSKKCNAKDFAWQYLFPSRSLCRDNGTMRRHHLFPTGFQAALKAAGNKAGINKRVHPHVLRHSFATHALESGWLIQKLQAVLGHKDVRTTLVYLHCVDLKTQPTPVDLLCL